MPVARVGPYTLIKPLAEGGMAEVWIAREQRALGASRLVVLKRILAQHAHEKEFLHSFVDEARLAVRLNHPNIVQVLEVGETAAEPYLALELVDGIDLERLLYFLHEHGRRLPAPLAVRIAAEVLRALDHAHTLTDESGHLLDVVHRDVSPPNILLGRDGRVKLADFGIAKARGRLTKTHLRLLKGKTPYMSPEQVAGRQLDGRADLFALGAVLWECLVGRRLFDSGDDLVNLQWVQHRQVPPPSSSRTGVDARLDAVVLGLLQRDVGERFATARAALAALERTAEFAASRAEDLSALVSEAAPDSLSRLRLPTAEWIAAQADQPATAGRRLPRQWLVLGGLVLVLLLASIWVWRQTSGQRLPGPDRPAADIAGATLIVRPATAGVVALWDGEPIGQTPLLRQWPVDGKRHELTLLRPGYAPWRRQIEFDRPRTIDANVALTPLTRAK